MARIKDYPETQSMGENDYLAIDGPDGVRKIKKDKLITELSWEEYTYTGIPAYNVSSFVITVYNMPSSVNEIKLETSCGIFEIKCRRSMMYGINIERPWLSQTGEYDLKGVVINSLSSAQLEVSMQKGKIDIYGIYVK